MSVLVSDILCFLLIVCCFFELQASFCGEGVSRYTLNVGPTDKMPSSAAELEFPARFRTLYPARIRPGLFPVHRFSRARWKWEFKFGCRVSNRRRCNSTGGELHQDGRVQETLAAWRSMSRENVWGIPQGIPP